MSFIQPTLVLCLKAPAHRFRPWHITGLVVCKGSWTRPISTSILWHIYPCLYKSNPASNNKKALVNWPLKFFHLYFSYLFTFLNVRTICIMHRNVSLNASFWRQKIFWRRELWTTLFPLFGLFIFFQNGVITFIEVSFNYNLRKGLKMVYSS